MEGIFLDINIKCRYLSQSTKEEQFVNIIFKLNSRILYANTNKSSCKKFTQKIKRGLYYTEKNEIMSIFIN